MDVTFFHIFIKLLMLIIENVLKYKCKIFYFVLRCFQTGIVWDTHGMDENVDKEKKPASNLTLRVLKISPVTSERSETDRHPLKTHMPPLIFYTT